MKQNLRTPFALLAVFLWGCAPSVEDICDRLDDECSDVLRYDECVRDGESLQDDAVANGCGDLMDTYLDCLDEAGCGWRQQCASLGDDLFACVEPAP